MKPDESFYDDPQKFLGGIGYSSTEIRLSPKAYEAMRYAAADLPTLCETCQQNRKTCGCLSESERVLDDERIQQLRSLEITDAQKVIPSNAGAHEEFESKTRAIFESGEAHSIAEAQRIAREELPDLVHPQSQEEEREADYLGDSIESLMARKSTGKGGGGSGKSREKTFPKRCKVPDCHMQYCEHRARRGRPKKANAKVNPVRTRISDQAQAGFKNAGVLPSQAMEILGIALMTGKTFEEVRLNHPPATIPRDAA